MAVTTPSLPATATPVINPTGQNVDVAVTIGSGTVTGINVGWGNNPAPGVVTPAVPATTVPVTNTSQFPVAVTIAANGATISAITINGTSQGTAAGTYIVPAGGTIALSYTVATPTWTWATTVAGVTGTLSGTVYVPLPPGCNITLTYSAAGTMSWAWTNPLDEAQRPDFGYPFNSAVPTPNQYTNLPYAQHATLGLSNLATGVSN